MIAILVITFVLGLSATGGYMFLRTRPAKQEPVHRFRCPYCRRKARYRESRAGHKGMCPLCGQHFLFPLLSVSPGSRSVACRT
jgi:hypothetical protein